MTLTERDFENSRFVVKKRRISKRNFSFFYNKIFNSRNLASNQVKNFCFLRRGRRVIKFHECAVCLTEADDVVVATELVSVGIHSSRFRSLNCFLIEL